MSLNNHFAYLCVDVLVLLFPLVLSFTKKFYFINEIKNFVVSNLIVSLFFIVWDAYFTYQKVWTFNDKFIIGVKVYNLPIEEVLFFVFIPYACVFSYYAIFKIINFDVSKHSRFIKYLSYILVIIQLLVGMIFWRSSYTYAAFVSNALFIVYLLYSIDVDRLVKYFVAYLFVIPFFIMSNGVLTGSFVVSEPIVIYNSNEIIGFRVFNIPVEDFFYGMLLINMNISKYDWIKKNHP